MSYFSNLNFFQGKSGVCHTCRFPSFRLHACLYCVYFGCYTTKHIHEHAFSKNHNLGTYFTLSLSLIIIWWNLWIYEILLHVFIINGVLFYSFHSCWHDLWNNILLWMWRLCLWQRAWKHCSNSEWKSCQIIRFDHDLYNYLA